MNSLKIIIFGAPGAGKGTISSLLAEKYKIPHISTGDLFRKEIENKTPFGLKIKEKMDSGKFISDKEVIDYVKNLLQKKEYKKGFILDGFPRTIKQAEELDNFEKIDVVINLQIDEDYIVKRLLARRNCPKCGKGYNLITSLAPKNDEICDICKVKLVKRADDNEEVIKERQKTYKEQTAPLIDYYRKKKLLKDIDASGTPEEIVSRIAKIL